MNEFKTMLRIGPEPEILGPCSLISEFIQSSQPLSDHVIPSKVPLRLISYIPQYGYLANDITVSQNDAEIWFHFIFSRMTCISMLSRNS